MKVIQIPFCFYPDPVGGTEVYVDVLSRYLLQQSVDVVIATPGKTNESYMHHQLPVRRYAISNTLKNLREIYGEGDTHAAKEFSHILETEKPDLLHLHAFTSGISLKLVQAAQQRKIPVVFTYHTPTVSCLRGTLMHWGTQICNGKLDLHTCAQCTLQGLGLDQNIARAIGGLPPQVGRSLGNLNLQRGVWTALRMTELVSLRHAAVKTLLSQVDRIVAVCDWIKDLLLVNNVPPQKITVIRQGLCHDLPEKINAKCPNSTLKIAFLGRLNPTKGIHVLIQALRVTPQLPITFDIYGVSQGAADNTYEKQLQALAIGDRRINFKPPVPTEQVISTLGEYDLLAVPSQWLETGPMVVLEAFFAGVPVVGSNLGGIAELVQSEVNGILVEPSSVAAWSQTLQRLCHDRELLMSLRANIKPTQKMDIVATQMLSIYQTTLQSN